MDRRLGAVAPLTGIRGVGGRGDPPGRRRALLHEREPVPSMVMVDAQTVKGGRYGPTLHQAGGRGGRTIGTKRTLLVEILGLPVAAAACSARPHDVTAARELLRDRVHPDLAAVQDRARVRQLGRWRHLSRCYEGSEASARAWLEVASVGYLAWRAVARSVRRIVPHDGGREEEAMADPVGDIIGDYRAFAAQQSDRLLARGIDIAPYALSHLAFRVPEWDQYVHVRTLLERHATSNLENFWNGRPISLILPAGPLEVLDGKAVPMIELIPPVHQRVYKMGLEHLGVVVGDTFDTFVGAHKPVLTGQQFQGPNSTPDPVYILFEDFTHVKFYRLSLRASVELDGYQFEDGFHHVDDWAPQRLVTATGPNPLPR